MVQDILCIFFAVGLMECYPFDLKRFDYGNRYKFILDCS